MEHDNLKGDSPYVGRPWTGRYDYWVPVEATFPRQSIYQALNLSALHYRDKAALVFLGAQMTFRELKMATDRFATALAGMGIVKGDRVGVMLPNCPEYVVSFFAITRLGAIVTNLNPLYTAREVEVIARDSGLKVLIVLDALSPLALAVQATASIEAIVTTSIHSYSSEPAAAAPAPAGTIAMSDLIERVSEVRLPTVEIDAEEDVAALVYTGGTTGVPKGAMLTHYNLWAAAVICELWGGHLTGRGEGAVLLVIPYFHIYGLLVGCVYGVWSGFTQIPIPKFDPHLLIDAIKRYQPTFFPGVPTLFISMINNPEAVNCGLDKILRFNSGSAPLPVDVIEKFEAMSGATLLEGYGMTETTAICTSTAVLAKRKPGSIGFPMTSTECRIVDLETGTRDVAIGEEGELCIRGPQIMKGYWNKPEETANALRDGWLYTGDVARMDSEGYLYIVQRKKDMIIVSGFNVYPNEIEDVLYTHPGVQECAVIGVDHKYRGESVKAFIVVKPGHQPSTDEITAFCGEKLARFKIPSAIEFVAALPKSAVGKVLRRELRDLEDSRQKKQE